MGIETLPQPPISDKLPSLIKMNNDFAFHLYKRLVEMPNYQSTNIFFSPLSVSIALSELCLGAGGETKEFLSGIGHNSLIFSTEEMHQMFHSLLEEIDKRTGVDIDVGSALSDKSKPLSKFLENMKEFYHSDGFTVDFSVKETMDKINTYVKEKTHGKIDQAVDDLESDTLMFLLTYIYFKDIDREDKTIKDLEMAISRKRIEKWTAFRKREVGIYVPKLSLKTSYSLKDILKGMGMSDMFTDKANFTGISEERIFISKALHKATLDIDEKGTTAAAVTTLVEFRPMFYSPMKTFRFDRPFMIFITDQKNDNILFFGKVINPAEKQ